jgi:hypothetical protein
MGKAKLPILGERRSIAMKPNLPFIPGLWGHSVPSGGGGTASVDRARAKADNVEMRLARALLTMEAMWTLLRDRFGITDEELAARIVELDESDGMLDGKVRRPPVTCTACARNVPSRFPRCLYCGEAIALNPFA